jgi:hypothetical protein
LSNEPGTHQGDQVWAVDCSPATLAACSSLNTVGGPAGTAGTLVETSGIDGAYTLSVLLFHERSTHPSGPSRA